MQKLPRVGGGGGGGTPPPTPYPRSGASRPRLRFTSNIVDNLAPPPPQEKFLRTALRGSQECGSRFVNFACKFHTRRHAVFGSSHNSEIYNIGARAQ